VGHDPIVLADQLNDFLPPIWKGFQELSERDSEAIRELRDA
jgi:hypothetical protein